MKESIKERDKRYYEARIARNPRRVWATGTLNNHRKDGLNVIISLDELEAIVQHISACEYCGEQLVYAAKGGPYYNSASLDRTNNEQELRLDNIKIVCYTCNSTKQGRTLREFVTYCKNIALRFKDLED